MFESELQPDYYSILNLPITASDEAIRRSYKGLAKILHPDKNPNDPNATSAFQLARHLPLTHTDRKVMLTTSSAPRSLLNPLRPL